MRPIFADVTDKPVLFDAFCCAGVASRGYQRRGFYVVGIDKDLQPHYAGDEFIQADAPEFLRKYASQADAGHGSPPCQAETNAQRIQQNEHPRLIAPTRAAFEAARIPYVIENVVPADPNTPDPMINPIMLCGAMFPGLRVYRHRLFEFGGGGCGRAA